MQTSFQEAIIVEGIYDKQKLESVCDALVVPTYGFSIFTDRDRLSYIRTLAEKTGVILLLDSDTAGFRIRTFLQNELKQGKVLHAYIPTISGKEKRKKAPSAEGTLGVEGISGETLLEILKTVCTEKETPEKEITSLDFYRDGLSGAPESAQMRKKLAEYLSLPPKLSPKALLKAVNTLLTYEEYTEFVNMQKRC